MTDRILHAFARLCLRHSKQITIVAAVLAVLAVAATLRLSFDPDLLNLIPQKNRQVNEFRKVLRDLGTIDYHIVVLSIPPGRDAHDYDPLIQNIANGYKASPLIADVSYRLPNPLDFVDMVLPRALLFLTPAELKEVAARLSDAGIRESVTRNRILLQTPQAFAFKPLVQYDPFNLAPIFLRKFQSAGRRIQDRHVERLLPLDGSHDAADPDQAEEAGPGCAVRAEAPRGRVDHRGARSR